MSSVLEEVASIGKEIDAIAGGSSGEGGLELLEKLSKLPIDIDIITKTAIGLKINNLRKKTSDEKLSKRAKALIKEWKSLLETRDDNGPPAKAAKKESGARRGSGESHPKEKEPKLKHKEPSNGSSSSQSSNSNKPSVIANFSSATFPPKHLENDEYRLKSAQLLLSALRTGEMPQGTLDPEELAVQIEEKIYKVHKGRNDKYSAAIRSRIFNLRDKKNLALRENVLTGVVKPDHFAVMTSEEMASPDIRAMRDKFTKESINEHQMSVAQGTPSDMFKCGKCGGKRCTYTQLQTRSSDEPMTTFVFCLDCGNRWKFC